jgi:hypothetical protein
VFAQEICWVQIENARLACALRREEAKVARVTRRLEAQEGDLLRLAGSDAARACDKEARGRLSLIEERLLS